MKFEPQQVTIRKFLLGQLEEQDRQLLEERLMLDSDFHQEVLMVEDELLESYLEKTLEPFECELFLKNYLTTPRQRQKLRFIRSLKKGHFSEEKQIDTSRQTSKLGLAIRRIFSRNKFLKLALACIPFLLAIAGFLVWRSAPFANANLREELTRLNSSVSLQPPGSAVQTFTLSGLTTREPTTSAKLPIKPTTQIVQLQVTPSNHFARYYLILATAEGSQIVEFEMPAQGKILTVQFPSKTLQAEDYLLYLSGLDDQGHLVKLDSFSFRVSRE
jgi:hypothetical protein